MRTKRSDAGNRLRDGRTMEERDLIEAEARGKLLPLWFVYCAVVVWALVIVSMLVGGTAVAAGVTL